MIRKTVRMIVIGLVFSSCASLQANNLSKLYDRVNPSVVVIKILEQSISEKRFGEIVTQADLGSGVIISEEGLVMTAAHVVQVADAVSVTLIDGQTLSASVVGSFPMADVALVKINNPPAGLAAAKLGDSDKVRTGDPICVIGAPRGLEHTLTVGYISGRRSPDELMDNLVPVEFLQTDAAINAGNSGGPMFNLQGEVIGIVSSIVTESGGFEGIGFAAAINTARRLLIDQKPFWTGLETILVSGPLAEALNVPQGAGLLIQRVADNSPGQQMGLRAGNIWVDTGDQKFIIGGDIILSVDGIPVTTEIEDWKKIRAAINEKGDLSALGLKVLRGSKIVDLGKP